MKGDTCGFLHEFNAERMPVCRSLLKYGICKEPDCPYKHSLQDIKVHKHCALALLLTAMISSLQCSHELPHRHPPGLQECNMFKLGFCVGIGIHEQLAPLQTRPR